MNADTEIRVRACGREWILDRPADLESLWDAMCADPGADEDRIPYWTELWPSSLALCAWLEERRGDIAGRPCLDMGCGLGLTAMAGALLGARVLGMDHEPEALRFARRNAEINGIPGAAWAVMDWRRPATARGAFDFVWGGDVMYERDFAGPVLRFLDHVLAPGGAVWLAEPGRTVFDHFLRALNGGGNGVRWSSRPVCERRVEPVAAQPVPVTVRIRELRRL